MFKRLKAGNILISNLEFTCSNKQIRRFDIFIVIDVFQNSIMLLHPKHGAIPWFDDYAPWFNYLSLKND